MAKKLRYLAISFLLLASLSGKAQEKVFVHLDRTYYSAGETAWLKAYVTDVQAPDGEDNSRFLYLELLAENGKPVLRTKVKEGPDGLSGHLDLPETLHSGSYLLRAYTRWQLDGPESAMFHVPVRIFGAEGDVEQRRDESREGALDLSFYPEGGRCFTDEMAIIGFKAMAPDGSSVSLEGTVYDDTGKQVAMARTQHEGMGLFGFTPQEGRRYTLVEDATGRSWPLPGPATDGATLQVRWNGDRLNVTALNHSGAPGKLLLRVAGEDFFLSDIAAGGQMLPVAAKGLKPGLQKFILTDAAGNILSERAVFVESPQTAPVPLHVQTEGEGYTPRTKHSIRLRLPADVDPGEVSVSVVRHAFRPYLQEGGIASYMLLGSELRGYISDPDYYFDPNVPEAERRRNLDLLLLIQGWTYYDAPFVPTREKERTQSLRGEIRGLGKRTPRNYSLAILAPAINYSQVVTVPRAGRFVIDSLDFRDSTLFLMNVTRDGMMQNYAASFAPDPVADELPGWRRDWRLPVWRPGQRLATDVPVPAGVPFTEDIFVDSIRTAVVQADRVQMRSPFGSTPVFNPATREKLRPYDHMSILKYTLMMHPTFEETTSDETGETLVRETREYKNFGFVKLCINGSELPWDLGGDILIGDVETYKYDKNSSDAFLMKCDGVVLVELSGPERQRLADESNSTVFVPLGWQTPRHFYHPRYDKSLREWMPDKRNTIYWSPRLELLPTRDTPFTFFTDDQLDGPYVLRIEGRTEDGRWISEERLLF